MDTARESKATVAALAMEAEVATAAAVTEKTVGIIFFRRIFRRSHFGWPVKAVILM